MRVLFSMAVAVMMFAAVGLQSAQASVIVGATSVISPQGDFGGAFALVNAINQSGLSAGYTSGVTDFGTFVAGTTHDASGSLNSGFNNAQGPPGQFSFDLGAVQLIDALAMWDTQNSGWVTSFDLYADNDQNFGNGVGAFLGTFNPTGGGFGGFQPSSAQVFGFGATASQFFHIDVKNMEGGTNLVPGIGEIAFSNSDQKVPEPGTIAIWSVFGLVGLGIRRRKS